MKTLKDKTKVFEMFAGYGVGNCELKEVIIKK